MKFDFLLLTFKTVDSSAVRNKKKGEERYGISPGVQV